VSPPNILHTHIRPASFTLEVSLSETGILHGLEHHRSDLGGRVGDVGTRTLEGLDLVRGGTLSAGDDGTWCLERERGNGARDGEERGERG
jgi:hypothetical protein